ncbi:MAG: hypothetical protein K2Q32_05920, partial [Alphaproteobacteria bacterium]|nr:hypothetical protein [Alphaproteobacteria bacterium]
TPINDYQNLQDAAEKTNQVLDKTDDKAQKITDKLTKLNDEFKKTADTIKNQFSKSLTDAIHGGDTFSKTFDAVRKSLEDLAIKTAVVNPLSNFLFGGEHPTLGAIDKVSDVLPAKGTGGLLGELTNGIADLFGARAFGGPVGAGQPFLVGERGPELFIPQTAGRINPDVGGGSVNITMNITATDAASFQASQSQIAASMMDAARRAQRIR